MVASVGIFAMPNSVWQMEVLRSSCSERRCARNDSGRMKNSEKAGIPTPAMEQVTAPFRSPYLESETGFGGYKIIRSPQAI